MEAILVAVITAIGGIIAVLVQKSREENKQDHGKVMEKLIDLHKDVHHVESKVDNVDYKLDQHLSLDHVTTKVKTKSKRK
jgi:uncharacterized lipoprotein YehR (DUF1307 family)